MTTQPPNGPPPAAPGWVPPPAGAPKQGGSILLGVFVGVITLVGLLWLLSAGSILPAGALDVVVGLFFVLPVVYLVTAIILAVRPRTRRFGAGLLIAIPVAILGVCTAVPLLITLSHGG